jgi:hypothetical protein
MMGLKWPASQTCGDRQYFVVINCAEIKHLKNMLLQQRDLTD